MHVVDTTTRLGLSDIVMKEPPPMREALLFTVAGNQNFFRTPSALILCAAAIVSGITEGAHRALCARCAKSRLFSTSGSHGPQGREFCTLQPLLVHQRFFVSLMLATGPRALNSASHAVF